MSKAGGGNDDWGGISESQVECSAQHGEIIDVEIKVMQGKTKYQGKRRAADARMFDNFTPEQEKAFLRIGDGFSRIAGGIGHKSQIFVRVDRGQHAGDQNSAAWEAQLVTDYFAWHRECQKRRLDAALALDVICYGMNISESAQHRGTYRGRVSKNLIDCLNIYCWQHGWHTKQNAGDIADTRERAPPAPWREIKRQLVIILKTAMYRDNNL